MRDTRTNYIVVGTFILGLLAALLIWLAMLSGGTQGAQAYYMEFENVIGLTEGAQILFEGYPVGEIEEMVFARGPESSVYRVHVAIREGWQIPEDSTAVITQAGLLSSVVVDIREGMSKTMLSPGDRIPSLGATNILTTMSEVAHKLGELSDTSLKPLLDNLAEGTESLKDLGEDAPIILENLKTFTVQLNETTVRVNSLLDRTGGSVETILSDVETTSKNISTLTAGFRETSQRLDALLVSLNTLVDANRKDIDHSVEDLHHTLEVVASHVQEISYNLEATTRNMNELTAEIRQNPGLIIRGREFREDREAEKK